LKFDRVGAWGPEWQFPCPGQFEPSLLALAFTFFVNANFTPYRGNFKTRTAQSILNIFAPKKKVSIYEMFSASILGPYKS
jgi:hypothetical protein